MKGACQVFFSLSPTNSSPSHPQILRSIRNTKACTPFWERESCQTTIFKSNSYALPVQVINVIINGTDYKAVYLWQISVNFSSAPLVSCNLDFSVRSLNGILWHFTRGNCHWDPWDQTNLLFNVYCVYKIAGWLPVSNTGTQIVNTTVSDSLLLDGTFHLWEFL